MKITLFKTLEILSWTKISSIDKNKTVNLKAKVHYFRYCYAVYGIHAIMNLGTFILLMIKIQVCTCTGLSLIRVIIAERYLELLTRKTSFSVCVRSKYCFSLGVFTRKTLFTLCINRSELFFTFRNFTSFN